MNSIIAIAALSGQHQLCIIKLEILLFKTSWHAVQSRSITSFRNYVHPLIMIVLTFRLQFTVLWLVGVKVIPGGLLRSDLTPSMLTIGTGK